MGPDHTTMENSSRAAPAQVLQSGLPRYFCLVAGQTTGAAIVLVNGLPNELAKHNHSLSLQIVLRPTTKG